RTWALAFVFDQFGAEADGCDRRTQIVTERPEHVALTIELTPEAFGHGVEGGRSAAHVLGAADGGGDICFARTERAGGVGEIGKRPADLARDEGCADADDDDRDDRADNGANGRRAWARQTRGGVEPASLVEAHRNGRFGNAHLGDVVWRRAVLRTNAIWCAALAACAPAA